MMLTSISPVGIVKLRPRFGQVIVPKPGSVVASPVLAAYDPEPDYFFHWYRDSALVMDALRLLRSDLPQAEGLFQDLCTLVSSWMRWMGEPRRPIGVRRRRRILSASCAPIWAAHMARRSRRKRASIPTALSTSPIGPGRSMTARRLRALP